MWGWGMDGGFYVHRLNRKKSEHDFIRLFLSVGVIKYMQMSTGQTAWQRMKYNRKRIIVLALDWPVYRLGYSIFFNYHVNTKVTVGWVQLDLAKVAHKEQVFSFLTKHVDLSQITWPLSQSVNCTAIIVVILLFWVFRSIGREGPLLTRAENFSYKHTVNAVFPQVIWIFWLKKLEIISPASLIQWG